MIECTLKKQPYNIMKTGQDQFQLYLYRTMFIAAGPTTCIHVSFIVRIIVGVEYIH